MTWIGVLVSGCWWGAAVYFLPPLPVSSEALKSPCAVPTVTVQKVTYCSLFFLKDEAGIKIEKKNDNLVLGADTAL